MPLTFEQSQTEIAHLVRHFTRNRAQYLAAAYKEAHARQEFIDPLFSALNWDVYNQQRAAPDYREVVLEDSLEIEGQKKAPDYAFRVGARERKFFAEAKKPGVDLKNAAGPAYQLRRYAWSAKLPLSLLTDFEELAVYDCRPRPADQDKPSVARINYLKFEEYADRWREVWDIFSRGAVLDGSFDQFAQSAKGRRGASEVDAEFLKEIEGWRQALARNIALRNPRLTIDELNDAVQRTIDRIIFLRMAEDRGIEDYGRLQRLAAGADIYAGLLDLARQADARYNSGLFDFSKAGDRVTPGLTVDDRALKPILADLYFPRSPYEFSVLPAEILGNVYEQFLGKVIRLTAGHQAKVEEKPEVKKAGGVYYTPAYIVAYIVQNTLGRQVRGKSPRQLHGFRVLDMACGSGSFLLGAYQFLLDYYRDWYVEHDPEKHPAAVRLAGASALIPDAPPDWRLTSAERKRILLEHLFGVDIDRQAVEVTKLSLLLKVLEGENDETLGQQLALLRERALPNLDRNIKCGNSLIGPDYFSSQLLPDADELRRVNPFDWAAEFPEALKAGGFDCVIGNPPYIRIQTLKEWAPLEVEAYKQLYRAAAAGNYDIYVVFVEKGLSLLNEPGRLGFILPHKFFNAQYGAELRGLLAAGRHLSEVIHFGDQQVFAGATTYTCLLFLDKAAAAAAARFVKAADLAAWRARGQAVEGSIPAASLTAAEWNFAVGPGAALFEKLSRMPVKLGDVAERIFQGLVTSADQVYFLEPIGDEEKGLIRVISKATEKEYELEIAVAKPLCKGSKDVRRYFAQPSKRVLFPYDAEQSALTGKTILISQKDFIRSYGKTWKYLNENIDALRNREKGKMRVENWYGYVYPKSVALFAKPKLLTPSIASHASFTFDKRGSLYFAGSGGGGGGGYGIILKEGSAIAYEYLLGLLNSKLLDHYLKQISSPFSGGYYAYSRQFIEQLPIRPINFTDPADQARHAQMAALVEQMLDLHQRRAAADAAGRERLQRLIDAADQQIDALVYELYGLTPEEIALVEGAG